VFAFYRDKKVVGVFVRFFVRRFMGVDFGIFFCAVLFSFIGYYFSPIDAVQRIFFVGCLLYLLLISVASAIFEKPL
jgi:hypothetical protein